MTDSGGTQGPVEDTSDESRPEQAGLSGKGRGGARSARWRAVGVLGELTLTAGVLVLLFALWMLWWTDVTAAEPQRQAVVALQTQLDTAATASATPASDTASTPASPVQLGNAYAIIKIPRFGAEYAAPAYQGTDPDVLRQGMGHYAETAQPGEVGNASFAGHRTTYGHPLSDIDRLQVGDAIVMQTARGAFVYRVESQEIVDPSAVAVIAPVPGSPAEKPTRAMLTFTSCHPRFSAQQRYIIHAALEKTYRSIQDVPADVFIPPTER
jgi:sortase A